MIINCHSVVCVRIFKLPYKHKVFQISLNWSNSHSYFSLGTHQSGRFRKQFKEAVSRTSFRLNHKDAILLYFGYVLADYKTNSNK